MEAVGLASGEERAMRTSAFRVRFAQRRGFYWRRVSPVGHQPGNNLVDRRSELDA